MFLLSTLGLQYLSLLEDPTGVFKLGSLSWTFPSFQQQVDLPILRVERPHVKLNHRASDASDFRQLRKRAKAVYAGGTTRALKPVFLNLGQFLLDKKRFAR
ncbi:MAG: hypothetical protein QXI02_01255 [Candidatus Caldarchaeum sp.]